MLEKEPGQLIILRRYLPICVLSSAIVILGLWTLFYFSYSTNGLPLGWDTPYYVWRIHTAAVSGLSTFAASARYYDFLYPAVGSLISLSGLDAFSAELLVPVFLWIVGTLIIVAIVKREMSDAKASLIALAAGSTWFGLFRLSSDLHANLLGLVLMLGGTWLFLHSQGETRLDRLAPNALGLGAIIILSSLAHIETTIFISATWLLGLVLSFWRGLVSFQRFMVLSTTISLSLLPGVIIFWYQQQWVAGLLQGRLPAIPATTLATWILYLGPVGLVCLFAVPVVLYLKHLHLSSRIIVLTFSWLFLSLTIGLAQYLDQSITPFSERAIILTPTPFLAAILVPLLKNFKLTSQVRGIGLIFIIITGASAVYYVGIGHQYYSSFISNPASASLKFLQSSGVIDPNRSIFILSDAPNQVGSPDHSDFWVGAYLGDHYSYLGRLDFLMAGMETPFRNDQSAQISRLFLNGLPIAQVRNMTIVYIADFNYPNPMPSFYTTFLHPLGASVYEVNQTAWNSNLVLIPAYSSVLFSEGGWFSGARTWTKSGSSLELNSTQPSQVANVSFAFAVPQNATYNIGLRLWDGLPSNPVSVLIDGTNNHQISYTGMSMAVNVSVFSGVLTRGVHTLTISVGDEPTMSQYLSLDYVSIARP
jgi:hypothetical protein